MFSVCPNLTELARYQPIIAMVCVLFNVINKYHMAVMKLTKNRQLQDIGHVVAELPRWSTLANGSDNGHPNEAHPTSMWKIHVVVKSSRWSTPANGINDGDRGHPNEAHQMHVKHHVVVKFSRWSPPADGIDDGDRSSKWSWDTCERSGCCEVVQMKHTSHWHQWWSY